MNIEDYSNINEKIQVYLNWITGIIFIGFGLRVAFSERR